MKKQFIPVTGLILLPLAVIFFLRFTHKNPTDWSADLQALAGSNLIAADFYPDHTEGFTRDPHHYAHGTKATIRNGIVKETTDVTFTENWQKNGNLFSTSLLHADALTTLAETIKTKGKLHHIQARVDERGIPCLYAYYKANNTSQMLIATLDGVEIDDPILR